MSRVLPSSSGRRAAVVLAAGHDEPSRQLLGRPLGDATVAQLALATVRAVVDPRRIVVVVAPGDNELRGLLGDDLTYVEQTERLGTEQLGPRQEAEYARLDRKVMRQAPWAPFGNLTLSTFVSSAVELDKLVINPVYGVDLATFQLK